MDRGGFSRVALLVLWFAAIWVDELGIVRGEGEQNPFGIKRRHKYRTVLSPRNGTAVNETKPLSSDQAAEAQPVRNKRKRTKSVVDEGISEDAEDLKLARKRKRASKKKRQIGDDLASTDKESQIDKLGRQKDSLPGGDKSHVAADSSKDKVAVELETKGTVLADLPQQQLEKKQTGVWLYSLLSADYDGAVLLPHFLNHYSELGIATKRMLFVVHHNAMARDAPPDGLSRLTDILHMWDVDYRVWVGQYSADAHLKFKLMEMQKVPLEDWVVIADSDEFQDYEGLTVDEYLRTRLSRGSNYVRGRLVDRVSATGRLTPMKARPSISEQYPLRCHLTKKLTKAEQAKIVVMRGFLRTGSGNHGVVPPEMAAEYYGPAAVGELSARYGYCGAEDLYPLTPYARFGYMYAHFNTQSGNPFLWTANASDFEIFIHHFKWHEASARSIRDRLRFYKGEDGRCVKGRPRFKFWRESQRLYDVVVLGGGVNVTNRAYRCRNALVNDHDIQHLSQRSQFYEADPDAALGHDAETEHDAEPDQDQDSSNDATEEDGDEGGAEADANAVTEEDLDGSVDGKGEEDEPEEQEDEVRQRPVGRRRRRRMRRRRQRKRWVEPEPEAGDDSGDDDVGDDGT